MSREDRIVEAVRDALEAAGVRPVLDGTPWSNPVDAQPPQAAWVEWSQSTPEDRTMETELGPTRVVIYAEGRGDDVRKSRRLAFDRLGAIRQALGRADLSGLVDPAWSREVSTRNIPQQTGRQFLIEATFEFVRVETVGAWDDGTRYQSI